MAYAASKTADDDALVLTETIPWRQGSTLQVVLEEDISDGECFFLQSTSGKFVTLDIATGVLKATVDTLKMATAFAAVSTESYPAPNLDREAQKGLEDKKRVRTAAMDITARKKNVRNLNDNITDSMGRVELQVRFSGNNSIPLRCYLTFEDLL